MLMPRNFGMVMDLKQRESFPKPDWRLHEIFEEKNYLFNHWVLRILPAISP